MPKVVWYTEHGHDSKEFEDVLQARVFADEMNRKGNKTLYIPGKSETTMKIDKTGKKRNIREIYHSGNLGWNVLQRALAQYHAEEMGQDIAYFGLSEINAL